MNIDEFIDELADLQFSNVFNPYSDETCDIDDTGAAAIRRHNLRIILTKAISEPVQSLWIARDLGYRGGRRTGLALTDELHLSDHGCLFGVDGLRRATIGPAVGERTATVIWQMLKAIGRPVFLWNVFPLHPHQPDELQSNRCHTRHERLATKFLLEWLLQELKPKHVVAIGRDAELALLDLGISATKIRHPSYGGQTEFIESMSHLYGISSVRKEQKPIEQPILI